MESYQKAVQTARPEEVARYHGGSMAGLPTMLVVHATAGDTAAGAISWLNRLLQAGEHKASYHYIIDRREERIVRTLAPGFIAYHAGVSAWPKAPILRQSVNGISLGVAFANDNGSDGDERDDPLTPWQKAAGLWLCVTLCRRFGIPADRVLAHREVSPGRKTDPLPRILDMPSWRAAIDRELPF